jgi:hypothetical protein
MSVHRRAAIPLRSLLQSTYGSMATLRTPSRNKLRTPSYKKPQGEFMTTWKITLIASLIGTAVGFWNWKLDLTKMVWPGHLQLAGFFFTLIATVAVQLIWPKDTSKT